MASVKVYGLCRTWGSTQIALLILAGLMAMDVELCLCDYTFSNSKDGNGVQNGSWVPKLWPLPAQFRNGHGNGNSATRLHPQMLKLSEEKFVFQQKNVNQQSSILQDAFQRYREIIFRNSQELQASAMATSAKHQPNAGRRPHQELLALVVHAQSDDEKLRLGTDESYTLSVPDPSNSSRAFIEAKTVFGALRALETFSQLCVFDFDSKGFVVRDAPWHIVDQPRFKYRGLLIDTARHYQPLRVIKDVIDAMSYAKLNVLHWHIVDKQSFPLEIPSYPKLWQGAFSSSERYTIQDAAEIVEYARRRGVNVMPELDVPGHAASWGVGYPELWPSPICNQPLDVSKNFTFRVIDGIISDFSKVFPFDLVHMGGDEVNTSCWNNTPRIKEWLIKHNLTGFGAYKEFVLKAESISISHGYTPVNWEEPFDNFGSELNKNTVIHNWLGPGLAPRVVKAGFKCIVSNQDMWYLDHLDISWETFYMNEPLTNITDPEEQKLVLGGEVCLWGETVDASDIQQTIWPRAAAAAERLWSSFDQIPKDPNDVLPRLTYFRCLLNQRGVAAAPLFGFGRDTPIEPGSCYTQ